MAVTHQKIADRLGISRSLVTLALQRTRRFSMSEETRTEIENVAREMGYQPPNLTTRNIGLLVSPGQMRVQDQINFIHHVERRLRDHGFRLMLVNPEMPAGQRIENVINAKTVDGLLLMAWENGRHASLLSARVPGILLSEEEGVGENVERVATDLPQTLRNIIGFLHLRGHSRLALLSSTQGSSHFYRRAEMAARDAVRELKWPKENLRVVQSGSGEAAQEVLKLMDAPHPPTAVIAADATRALLLLNGLLAAGKRVPRDISVVSIFDNDLFDRTAPALTATTAGGAALADRAVRRLLEKIEIPETVPRHEFIAGEIIERQSVAA